MRTDLKKSLDLFKKRQAASSSPLPFYHFEFKLELFPRLPIKPQPVPSVPLPLPLLQAALRAEGTLNRILSILLFVEENKEGQPLMREGL